VPSGRVQPLCAPGRQPAAVRGGWTLALGGWIFMMDATWQLLTTAPNVPAARALASMLESQGVACQLKADTSLLGEARQCAVWVESALLHRAKWLLEEASFTDAELDFLATGQLSCDDAKEDSR